MSYQFEESGKLKEMTAEELAKADNGIPMIILTTGSLEDNTPYWAYVEVKPSRYKEFMNSSESGKILALDDYGSVIKYGFEEEVPLHVKEEMARLHGCDEDYMKKLAEKIRKAQTEFLKEQENKRISGIVTMLKNKPQS